MSLGFPKHIVTYGICLSWTPKHIFIYGICLSWTCAGLRRDASYCCQRLATGWSTQRQQFSACWHPPPFVCPVFLPSLFPWFIVDEYQLWESKGRNILSSQHVVNVTSLLSILNFRTNLFNCSFVYSLTHLFMMGTGNMWMSGDNLQEPFLSFYHVHSGHGSKVDRLGGKDFYLLKCPSVPLLIFVRFYFIFNCAWLCVCVCAMDTCTCMCTWGQVPVAARKGCLITLN